MNYGLEDFLGKAEGVGFHTGQRECAGGEIFRDGITGGGAARGESGFGDTHGNRNSTGDAGRVRVEEFVPFGKLLKHASVFIHHGGIGTMSQGFRAGVPQMVMAMAQTTSRTTQTVWKDLDRESRSRPDGLSLRTGWKQESAGCWGKALFEKPP